LPPTAEAFLSKLILACFDVDLQVLLGEGEEVMLNVVECNRIKQLYSNSLSYTVHQALQKETISTDGSKITQEQ
jgi:hypothetical protein